ncbi:MAG: IS21 family transposase [Chitinophagaceae bacterium]|nr:MAG: IS21 family transposase [Chitinophagaceae bacterium]
MKNDAEVLVFRRERGKGKTQEQAAARAGMSVRTARRYEQRAKLPSESQDPRSYRTRPNPFSDDWPWVIEQLGLDDALQVSTLFGLLCERQPERYQEGQLRTLQRQIALWRMQHGPSREVMFAQKHRPGNMAQSDFTHMNDLQVSIGGVAFPHMVYHLVFTYSNVEAVQVCLSETFEALAEGFEACLWELGGVPEQHRTDHLSAAYKPLDAEGRVQATERYDALMAHYGVAGTTNTAGVAHENGDVEQSHYRLKTAVDQALRVRGSRDFPSRAAYLRFLHDLVRRRNLTRQKRWQEEQRVLRPLPVRPLDLCREVRVVVTPFSTIRVLRNTYTVPSRLIGRSVTVRVRSESVELYHGATHLLTMPRLIGEGKHRIDYRHVIWSLVRKPGAFANYHYREELFPSLAFRAAYDVLVRELPALADREYLRILHLAASTSEGDVEAALGLVAESRQAPTFDAVRQLVREPGPPLIPELTNPEINLGVYDRLLASGSRHG